MEKNKNLMWVVFLGFVGVHFLDMSFTMMGVNAYGFSIEGNPIVRFCLSYSPLLWLNIKLMGTLILLFSGFVYEKINRRDVYYFATTIFGSLLVIHNFVNLFWFFFLLGKI